MRTVPTELQHGVRRSFGSHRVRADRYRNPRDTKEHCGHPRPPQHGTLMYSCRRSFGIASRSHGRSASTGGSTRNPRSTRTISKPPAASPPRCIAFTGAFSSESIATRPGESCGRSKTGELACPRAPARRRPQATRSDDCCTKEKSALPSPSQDDFHDDCQNDSNWRGKEK